MERIEVQQQVSSDGTLQIALPLGVEEANKMVNVIIEPATKTSMSKQEWQRLVLSFAGSWQGDFERPPQGELEDRMKL
jgi:hypothetical protein